MPAADIKWAIDRMASKNKEYAVYEDYYDGNQKLLFATEKFRNAFGSLFREFSDNICPSVVDCFSQGMEITGFDGDKANDATTLWDNCHMARMETQVYDSAFKCGDAYVIVWPNKADKVRMWPQNASMCTVQYDDDDEPDTVVRAAKAWRTESDNDGKVWGRLNLYYPDRIERYRTNQPIKSGNVPTTSRGWTLLAKDGVLENEYGVVPMFHFGNGADLGDFGTSVLKDVVPLQDALNKSICDMLVAMEFQAFPQRWATGLQTEVDEDTGKPKNPPFTPGVDRIWSAPGDNVKFGQFDAGDLSKYVEVQNDIRTEVCRITGVPPYWMFLNQGEFPTGEGLKVSAGRRTKMLERCQAHFGPVWANILTLGLVMDNKLDSFDDADAAAVKPIWETASPHNPLLDAETELVNEQVGVSKRRSLKNLGYSDTEIDEMQDELDEEAQRQQSRTPQPLVGPDGKPTNPNANQPQNRQKGGKPTAFNRKGKAGQARQSAPQQQQGVKAPQPNPGQGQYST